MKFKAAVLCELKKPLEILEIEPLKPLQPGQVLVKIFYSGICGSQLGEIDGKKGHDKYLPHLLGHEGSGEVVEIGPGVRFVRPGDRVVLHWKKGSGIEAETAKFACGEKIINSGWVTTFSEYTVVSENRVTPIPADFDLRLAPLFGCAVTTGFGAVVNDAKLKIGESAVVFGTGGVGLNIVQAAAMAGAYPVIAVDLFDSRLELASKLGATHLINAGKTDAFEQIAKIIGNKLDVFFDNTGNPRIIEKGYSAVHAQGRLILIGVPKAGDNISIYSLPMHFGKTICGSFGGETVPQNDIPRYVELCRAGRLHLKEQISREYPLNDINTALDALRDGHIAGRCLIKMG